MTRIDKATIALALVMLMIVMVALSFTMRAQPTDRREVRVRVHELHRAGVDARFAKEMLALTRALAKIDPDRDLLTEIAAYTVISEEE